MNIKSILISMSVSISALSASELSVYLEDNNSKLTDLMRGYSNGTKTHNDWKNYITQLQRDIYGVFDAGKKNEANAMFQTMLETIAPIFESMDTDEQMRSGVSTLLIIPAIFQ